MQTDRGHGLMCVHKQGLYVPMPRLYKHVETFYKIMITTKRAPVPNHGITRQGETRRAEVAVTRNG